MRLCKNFAFLAVFALCIAQTSVACDNLSASAGPAPNDNLIVILSAVITHSGAVREAAVLSGPPALRTAAVKAVKQYKHRGVKIDNWGTTPVGNSARRVMFAVTFPQEEGTPPKVQQAMSAGVPSCLPAQMAVLLSAEAARRRLLTHVDPVFSPDLKPLVGPIAMRVRIDKEGNVFQVEKISGPDAIFPAVSEAVKQWKYQPYVMNGSAVDVETTVIVGQVE